jgi:hypothetical protein
MAYTATKLFSSVYGNKRVEAYSVVADATSGSVVTGLSVIDAVSMAPVSMATSGVKMRRNLSAASAAANGSLMIDDAASGDVFEIVVHGR